MDLNGSVVPAIASAIAAIGSCVAAWLTYRYNHNKGKQSQAQKVAAWISSITIDQQINANVIVVNKNDLPIYDVFIIGHMNNKKLADVQNWSRYHSYMNSVIPGKHTRLMRALSGDIGGKHMVLAMFFKDSAGNEWCRDGNGILSEQKDYECLLSKHKIFAPYT